MSERYKVIPAAIALICESEPGQEVRVLLQRRNNTGYRDGYWDAPSGHIEEGEIAPEACTREISEEVMMTVDSHDLVLRSITMNIIETFGSHYQYLAFEVDKGKCNGEPGIGEPHKCDAIEWFPVNDLPEKTTPQVRVAVQYLGRSGVAFAQVTPDLL